LTKNLLDGKSIGKIRKVRANPPLGRLGDIPYSPSPSMVFLQIKEP